MSIITASFLMRPVFYKFLKFRKCAETSETPKCMGGAGRFWKNWKKKKQTPLPGLSTLVIWPRYDPQLNYSIGGNFNIHPPTFSMDGRFPFYHAPGSFPSQNFRHFDHTLAGPIIDHAGPSGILLNRSDSPASMVGESDSPTSSRLAEGLALKRKFTQLWYRMKRQTFAAVACR